MKQIIWTTFFLATLGATDASAIRPDEEATNKEKPRIQSEVLMQIEQPRPESDWLSSALQTIDVGGKGGLRYKHAVPLQMGERNVEFRVLGPRLKLQKGKAVGLRFEFRF